VEKLQLWGYGVTTIHGHMNMDARIEAEREFRDKPHILGAAVVIPLPEPLAPMSETDTDKPADDKIKEKPKPEETYQTGAGMKRDDEIEAVGMRVAMQYERKNQGWQSEDVSGENHGFDVRSTLFNDDGSYADIRYIEVKARAESGAIRLSANEWKKARHFADKYWLYIVTMAGTSEPQLHRIQNPAAHFTLDEDIFATGFIIPEDSWRIRKVEQDKTIV
jgi:hypothetical protein